MRHRSNLRWEYGEDGTTPVFEADFASETPGADEAIVINRESTLPLAPGTYNVGLVVRTPNVEG